MTIKQRIASFVASWLVDAANPVMRAQRPFERQTAGGFHNELGPRDRLQLLSDSRKLFSNLGPAKAAIVDKAVYSIGRAWMPKFTGTDTEFGKRATEYLVEQFYPLCDIRGTGDFQTQLHLESVSIDRDGDVAKLLTEDASGFARTQLIPSHMIGSRTDDKVITKGPYKGLRQVDGVALNAMCQPVGYCILGDDEDGANDRWVSARDLIFEFEPEWVDQVRGLPAFTHAILDLRDLRTVQGYERLASQIASSIGLIEWNETGMPDTGDPLSLLRRGAATAGASGVTSEDMHGGAVKYFRANSGSKLEFLKNERPGPSWESFMNRLIRNAYSGAGWPYELSWDAAALGGANIRLIVSRAMRAVEDRQDLLKPAARRTVGYAVAKAIKKGVLPHSDEWYKWDFSMPKKLSVDYGRDEKTLREHYLAGLVNLTDIIDERGGNLDAHIATRKAENQKLADAGLSLPGTMPAEPTKPEDDGSEENGAADPKK